MRKLFLLNGQDEYSQELDCAHEKAFGVKFHQSIEDFSFDYVTKNDIDVVICNGLSKEQYYLLRGANIVTITIGPKDKYSELSDIVIDHQGEDDKRYFTGENSRISTNDDFQIGKIVNLITKLEWDSNFFGFNVAYLSCMHLTENIMHRIEKFVSREKIRLVEYLCNCHNAKSVRLAERCGFHFVDIRLTYRLDLNKAQFSCNKIERMKLCESKKADVHILKQIASNSYVESRYYFDRHFTLEQCQRFYEDWISKSMKGNFDDIVFVAEIAGKIAGFISCKQQFKGIGKIGLVGIAPEFQGRGIGKHLIQKSIDWFKDKKLSCVDVVTQGRNYAGQRLYQAAGFKTKTVQLWYHKWI